MDPMKILLVDDHALVRQIVTNSIVALELPRPDEAASGSEALTKIQKALNNGRPYDLVFLDWNMEGGDGLDVLTVCRVDPRLSGMAIVMLTAESEQGNVMKAIKTGATSYIVKPFTAKKVQQTLFEISAWKKEHASTTRQLN